ncbi:MAG: hypothetical protein J5752_02875 [Clostridiales bacterium]|nr:hypothetical protein [Clostridiales bacterium]
MNGLFLELEARKQRLEKAIRNAEAFLQKAPEGRLRIQNRSDKSLFYHVTQTGDTRGTYIHSNNTNLAAQLAQKDYAKQFIDEARQELDIINKCIHKLGVHSAESLYSLLNHSRQTLVTPYMASNEVCTQTWLSQPFTTSTYKPEEKVFKTRRGEMVRSKSELMQADTYFELGIPYRYECELTLEDGTTKAPDFTLYHAPRRMTIYHEHLGLMDEEGYVNRNIKKLREYEENGIYVGKNLILTFETAKHPFNVHQFRETIKKIFWIN